jgi:hypothetical protein
MENKVVLKERGWAGHFICGRWCQYHRNTLLTLGNKNVVVSTVGQYAPYNKNGVIEDIGYHRFYETMAFRAEMDRGYMEMVSGTEISFESPWGIDHPDDDNAADTMHEEVVAEISARMESGEDLG